MMKAEKCRRKSKKDKQKLTRIQIIPILAGNKKGPL